MEVDECSAGGDSAEEEDTRSSRGERSSSGSSSSSSSGTGSTSSSDSDEDTREERCTSATDSRTSADEDNDEDNDGNINGQHPRHHGHMETLRWETCVAAGSRVKLPQDLCEHPAIFQELMDYSHLWQDCLSESQRESLSKFLPEFPEGCDGDLERERSVQMLFHRENHRFGVAALDSFHGHLSQGHFRPDIRRMQSMVRKAQQRRLVFEERKRTYDLAGNLLKSREGLLANAYKQGFSQPGQRLSSRFQWRKPRPAMVEERTRRRYLEELSALRAELGVLGRSDHLNSSSEDEENYAQEHSQHQQLNNAKKKKKRLPDRVPFQIQIQSQEGDEAVRPVFSTLHRSDQCLNDSIRHCDQSEDSYRGMLLAHKKRRARRDSHPELNIQGISLPDLTHRAQIGQKHKIGMGGSNRPVPAKKRIKLEQPSPLALKPSAVYPPPCIAPSPTPSITVAPASLLVKHESDHSDYHSTESETRAAQSNLGNIKAEPVDTYEPVQPPAKRKAYAGSNFYEKMSPVASKVSRSLVSSTPDIKADPDALDYDVEVKMEVIDTNQEREDMEEDEEDEKKPLDLENIDMMQIPIRLDDGIDILEDVKCGIRAVTADGEEDIDDGVGISGGELMQETHACFFALLRDAFVSKGEYCMSTNEMRNAVTLWQGNPISPLNDWYSMAPSWPALVPLALGFLAGDLTYSYETEQQEREREQELVPFLENKGRGVYAWIGAGRDSDSRLSTLCSKFLDHRDSLVTPSKASVAASAAKQQQQQQVVASSGVSVASGGGNSSRDLTPPIIDGGGADASGSSGALGEWEPPRALWPTEWKVRASTVEEREEFRRQERMRYAAPHKAFTYRMHGYASVVGPVKGIYQHNVASGLNKPRGHSLLVADRPNFVTILALVRDATARLPNGEGTRADICQLLKDSQYIRDQQADSDAGHDKEGYLHSVVSGALDRLHYEADPCVRYYPRRKEWLYLHRARSESEFEMYHQQLQGVAKNKKSLGGTTRNKSSQSGTKPTNGGGKEPLPHSNKEQTTPKRERKPSSQSQPAVRKEQRKVEEKIVDRSSPTDFATTVTTTATITTSPPLVVTSPAVATTTTAVTTLTTSIPNLPALVEREKLVTAEVKQQATPPLVKKMNNASVVGVTGGGSVKPITMVANAKPISMAANAKPITMAASAKPITMAGGMSMSGSAKPITVSGTIGGGGVGKPITMAGGITGNKPMAVVKTAAPQSLLQSNQQHFPHHQIQVSTSAGLQTIRLSGHSVLHSAQSQSQTQAQSQAQTLVQSQSQATPTSSTMAAMLPTAKVIQQQATPLSHTGKSILQAANIKQQQQQHVLPGKTLLASQLKLVSSGQIKSLLTGHGLQGQTIFIKQSSSPSTAQTQQQLQQHQIKQQQQQFQQRIVASQQQSPGMQRIIAQIGGKPIAVQIQQSSQQQQQQQQQQKILAKVLTSAGGGQLISVESLLAQKGLKLATAPSQVNKQGKQVIQAQYQVVSQAQASAGQSKLIVSSQQQQQSPQTTVRMVTAQLAGKPIVLASGSKTVNVGGKQTQHQQPIILPSQLLNIKTLHGLKVIPAPAGMKTGAVYARVIAPSMQPQQQTSQPTTTQHQQQPRNLYGNNPRQE